ncbi:RDD family protein [Halocola ammonii]
MKHLLQRGLAYYIDCIICFGAVMLILQWGILSNIRDDIGITDDWFRESWNMQLYVLTTISLPTWLYFAMFDSNHSKGTLGKRLFKLSVLRSEDSNRISFGKSFGRTILKLLPWEVAHLGVIFPTPLYFAKEPEIQPMTYIGIALFGIYVLSILLSKTNQSIYDYLLKTRVVKSSRKAKSVNGV